MRTSHAGEDTQKGLRLRLGLTVLVALLVLSVIEWYIAINRVPGLIWYLVVMQVVEAGLIAYYFMHVPQLWHGEGQSSGH